ncbi:MAG: polyprenol monophosphomannose synthase [Planctomycetota bacterium]
MKRIPGSLIVIATYNEMANLPRLIERLYELMPDTSVVVVDDNSPDGTWKWVRDATAEFPSLNLIHRIDERGLGSATMAGLKFGLENGFEWIGTMDADFSHDPESLSQMFDVAGEGGFDVVIGSRYVKGGGIDGWPMYRRLTSRMVNALARIWLGLKTRDNTGALRVYRANVLRELELGSIRSGGYAYLEEVLMRLQRTGAKVVEHPITFRDREGGKSKAGIRVGIAVICEILMMRFR